MLYISHIILYQCQDLKLTTSDTFATLPSNSIKNLKEKSDEEGIPIAYQVRTAINEYLEKN